VFGTLPRGGGGDQERTMTHDDQIHARQPRDPLRL